MNLHPEINSQGEFHLQPLFDGVQALRDSRWGIFKNPDHSSTLNHAIKDMVQDLIVQTCNRAPLCGDRTPYPLRSTFLPGVKQLYITRDGRDCLVSWAYHAFNRNIIEVPEMAYHREIFERDPDYFERNKHELLVCEEFVRLFASQWNNTILDDFAMMESADSRQIDLPYYRIRYEDLQADTLRYRNEMFEFLGANPEKAAPLTPQTQARFGDSNVNEPRNFFRRGVSGAWREYFTPTQQGWFEQEAESALQLVGCL